MKRSFIAEITLLALVACLFGDISVFADNGTSSAAEEASSAVTTYPGPGVDSFVNYSLPILVYGMAGIFIVLGLIAVSIYILGKIPSKEEKNK